MLLLDVAATAATMSIIYNNIRRCQLYIYIIENTQTMDG